MPFDVLTDTTGRFEPELTNFAIGAGEQELIGPIVAREIPTEVRSAKYPILGREKYLIVDSRGGEKEPAKQIERTYSTDQFDCDPHRLREFVSNQQVKTLGENGGAAAVANEEMDRVQIMTDNMMLERELEVATLLTTSGNYASGLYANLDSGTANFDDNGVKPLDTMRDILSKARQTSGYRLDTMIIAEDAWNKLCSDPNLLPSLTTSLMITEQQLASLLNLKRVLVAGALRAPDDLPKAGASYELSQLWPSNSIVFCLSPETQTRNSCPTIRTWMWNATKEYSQGRLVRSYYDAAAGDGGWWYQVSMAWGAKLTGVNSSGKITAGAYLANVYSAI